MFLDYVAMRVLPAATLLASANIAIAVFSGAALMVLTSHKLERLGDELASIFVGHVDALFGLDGLVAIKELIDVDGAR